MWSWSTNVTDRQTDGHAIAIPRFALRCIARVKTDNMHQFWYTCNYLHRHMVLSFMIMYTGRSRHERTRWPPSTDQKLGLAMAVISNLPWTRGQAITQILILTSGLSFVWKWTKGFQLQGALSCWCWLHPQSLVTGSYSPWSSSSILPNPGSTRLHTLLQSYQSYGTQCNN